MAKLLLCCQWNWVLGWSCWGGAKLPLCSHSRIINHFPTTDLTWGKGDGASSCCIVIQAGGEQKETACSTKWGCWEIPLQIHHKNPATASSLAVLLLLRADGLELHSVQNMSWEGEKDFEAVWGVQNCWATPPSGESERRAAKFFPSTHSTPGVGWCNVKEVAWGAFVKGWIEATRWKVQGQHEVKTSVWVAGLYLWVGGLSVRPGMKKFEDHCSRECSILWSQWGSQHAHMNAHWYVDQNMWFFHIS